ncbi:MAG TPA: GDSL-type esterase/lipase family protein [Lacibacter sp.]|nr:GDSL-type esterase/lipase family protein [Lacibacter sp.]HMO88336.1 GDSL-type esterase/lipase family protein [Lacibacter sp.]HMP85754.1 GDSL-type esterase/lipase family protein [Lacibacter sp.]
MPRLFLPLLVLLTACRPQANPPAPGQPTRQAITPKSYLALGDSYTIGQGVAAADRFPAQTVQWLQDRGIVVSALTYIATTGWTTTQLQAAIASRQPGLHDVVTLLIGVNDQYQARDTTGYRARFTNLLQTAITLARDKKDNVVVLSIPDYSVTPFAAGSDTARIRQELDWFNAINRNVTLAAGVVYLDITPSTREARTNPALLAADGLHPSALEYRRWALRLGPLLELALK